VSALQNQPEGTIVWSANLLLAHFIVHLQLFKCTLPLRGVTTVISSHPVLPYSEPLL
jgi:hypothetical protein